MSARLHTFGPAFFDHVETCDHCVIGQRLCAKGSALLEMEAKRAAERLVPIPFVVPGAKA